MRMAVDFRSIVAGLGIVSVVLAPCHAALAGAFSFSKADSLLESHPSGLDFIAVDENGGVDLVTVRSFDKWATVPFPEPSATLLEAAGAFGPMALVRRRRP